MASFIKYVGIFSDGNEFLNITPDGGKLRVAFSKLDGSRSRDAVLVTPTSDNMFINEASQYRYQFSGGGYYASDQRPCDCLTITPPNSYDRANFRRPDAVIAGASAASQR